MPERRFDQYLGQINADQLKPMMRLWGGSSQLRKNECIATIRQGLADPERVRTALAEIQPFERTALALLKKSGGRMEPATLTIGLHASGVPLPRPRSPYQQETDLIEALIRRGLLLADHSYDPTSGFYLAYNNVMVFSDDRLLAQVGAPELEPLPLNSTGPPESSTYRRPPAVILDTIGILQAIDQMGGLRLTQQGQVRVNEMRKLRRALGWPEENLEVDGMLFPSPVEAFVGALRFAGFLSTSDSVLALAAPVDQFASSSYTEPVSSLLHGFIQNPEWCEEPGLSLDWRYRRNQHSQGRLALTLALAALPVNTKAFFSIAELDQALFERIGEHFSLAYPPRRPFPYNKTPEQVREEEESWRAKLRADWLKREKPWIGQALSTWLYYLGLVELGMQDGIPVSVRLTDLGREALHPQPEVFIRAPDGEPRAAAWVAQPNFDVVAYLDRTTPDQLVFLERHAERVQAQQHTAQYRLTRESVYLSLENGTMLEELLAGLEAGNGAELPRNVVVEIREWASLREQITLRRQARLLEFPSERARQTALDKGLEGVSLGEKFLLVSARGLTEVQPRRKVDYARPLAPCLSVDEAGIIQLIGPPRDLLIRAQLDRWAEGMPASKWCLTPASVAAARGGGRIDALFNMLDQRLAGPLPPLLAVALRAWAGERLGAHVAQVTVLHCPQPEVFQAIVASEKTKPYLRGELAPDVLLVDPEQVTQLKKELAWAGLEVSDNLVVEPDRWS